MSRHTLTGFYIVMYVYYLMDISKRIDKYCSPHDIFPKMINSFGNYRLDELPFRFDCPQ